MLAIKGKYICINAWHHNQCNNTVMGFCDEYNPDEETFCAGCGSEIGVVLVCQQYCPICRGTASTRTPPWKQKRIMINLALKANNKKGNR